jgi:hypothetical protein
MRIEVTEKKLRDAGYNLVKDDTLTVPAELGKYWCDQGWARDVATKDPYPTGERKVEGATLKPHKLTVKTGVKGAK